MNRIELDNRKAAVKILNGMGWDAMPVENKAKDGTPDLNACKLMRVDVENDINLNIKDLLLPIEMWIEFKIVEEWPKRATTTIKIAHFSPQQKNWLRARIKCNPNCFIVIQIEEDHFLYKVTPDVIDNLGNNWTRDQMHRHCMAVSRDQEALLKVLEKGLEL